MNTRTARPRPHRARLAIVLAGLAAATPAMADNTLTGWAVLPADTFAPGPLSGRFTTPANGRTPPYPGQPVQGFSAVLEGPRPGTYHVMPDNGFGNKANSGDALLRVYGVQPDWRTASGGSGTVSPVDFSTGALRSSFDASTFIGLRDPDNRLSFPIVASMQNFPNGSGTIPVDASIRSARLLTGSDFDIESMLRDRQGNLWFGEEFGPYLVKTDATGKVLRSEIALPGGVRSPDDPKLGGATPNLNRSNGLEGMALNTSGSRLYTLLEGTVAGDPAKSLRINELDLASETFTSRTVRYRLDARGTNIGDMTAINDHEFLVIERDGTSGDPNGFKRIFRIDIDRLDADSFASKTEVVDLMRLADPDDLNRDGSALFNFPFVTIEDVLVLDANTLLVINDNNYPGGGGRGAGVPDNTEFLRIRLDQPLAVAPIPEPETYALMAAGLGLLGWMGRRRRRDD